MTKIPASRSFELHEVETFLRDKKIGPLEGFRSKAGWPFSAELKLVHDDEIKNWKLEFDFGDDAKSGDAVTETIDFDMRLTPSIVTGGRESEFVATIINDSNVGTAVTINVADSMGVGIKAGMQGKYERAVNGHADALASVSA